VSDDAIELEADEVCRLCSKSSSVKLSQKLTGGNRFFTCLELFLTGKVVTWVDTVWLDGDAAVVSSRTFLVGALCLVGEGAAVGTAPTFFRDAD
jgi:hypothetical protein